MIAAPSPIVFIVDDDEDMHLSMRRILKTVDLYPELFARAQDFLQKSIPDVPSCLVLGVRLPGMGGLEVQQKLIEAGIVSAEILCALPAQPDTTIHDFYLREGDNKVGSPHRGAVY